MNRLEEFRKKYPQYDRISDEELLDRIHKKDYPSKDKQDFKRRFLAEINPKKEFTKSEAFGRGFNTAVESTTSGMEQLATKYPGFIRSRFTLPSSAIELSERDIQDIDKRNKKLEDLDKEAIERQKYYDEAAQEKQYSTLLGNLIGALVSTPPIPGLGQAGAISKISANPASRKILGGVAGGAAGGALGSGLQYTSDDESRLDNMLSSALMGGGLGGSLGLIGASYNALKPSNLFRSKLPEEQLRKNLEVSAGTSTGLGNIIDSKSLNTLQNKFLSNVLASGLSSKADLTFNLIKDRGKEVLNSFAQMDNKQNVGSVLTSSLKDIQKEMNQLKRINYDKVSDFAEENGISTKTNTLQSTANKWIEKINEDEALARKIPTSLMNDLNFYASKNRNSTLSNANILKGELRNDAKNLYAEGKKYPGNIYSELSGALHNDIYETIYNSGSDKLKTLYEDAEKFYAKNIAPFETPEIARFIRKGSDPDTMLDYFVKSNKDRSILLSKLTNTLQKSDNPEEKMAILRGGVFDKAIDDYGQVDPIAFNKIFNSLSDSQKNILFQGNEAGLKNAKDYSQLVELNKNIFSGKDEDALKNFIETNAIKFGPSFASFLSFEPISAGLTSLGTIGAGRVASNLLTSEQFRQKLVEEMLNPGSTKSTGQIFIEGVGSLSEKNIPRAASISSTSEPERSKKFGEYN